MSKHCYRLLSLEISFENFVTKLLRSQRALFLKASFNGDLNLVKIAVFPLYRCDGDVIAHHAVLAASKPSTQQIIINVLEDTR